MTIEQMNDKLPTGGWSRRSVYRLIGQSYCAGRSTNAGRLAVLDRICCPGLSNAVPLARCQLRGRQPALDETKEQIVSKKPQMEASKSAKTASGGTVRLHRVFAAPPEKVYRAFLNADALAKWLPPYGFTCHVDHLDGKLGGTFQMSFTNFTTGNSHSFGGEYLELKANELIRYTDRFDDPNLPGTMHVTVKLKSVSCGTEINIEQSGIPTVIPEESCYLGWQQSLMQLALVVEPNIPEG
jgi:uncharacterized protein YndB with AHSA1/START domain